MKFTLHTLTMRSPMHTASRPPMRSITVRPMLVRSIGVLLTLAAATPAAAQLDRVYPASGNPITGAVTAVTKDTVSIKTSTTTQDVPVDSIRKIQFEGDPSGLTRGRELALDEQFDQAIEELRKVDRSKIKRELIQADAIYYLLFSEARQALAGQGSKDQSAANLLTFARTYPTNWHFYSVARLLGDLAVASGEYDKAATYYGSLKSSSSPQLQNEANYLNGLAQLRGGDAAAALTLFDQVIASKAESTAALRLQALAKAGRVAALGADGKTDAAMQEATALVAQLDPADVELAARIYNAQGAAERAAGDVEGAVISYLHTHLMFSAVPDAHAEALSQLVQLWPKLGKPERATEARQELQTRYPGWGN